MDVSMVPQLVSRAHNRAWVHVRDAAGRLMAPIDVDTDAQGPLLVKEWIVHEFLPKDPDADVMCEGQ
eukprot:5064694-Pyramimonas_sp.AAC.1